jgi:hypothetical protein
MRGRCVSPPLQRPSCLCCRRIPRTLASRCWRRWPPVCRASRPIKWRSRQMRRESSAVQLIAPASPGHRGGSLRAACLQLPKRANVWPAEATRSKRWRDYSSFIAMGTAATSPACISEPSPASSTWNLDLITPLILTWNEEPNLRRCLERLRWANGEVVVVDSGSTDATAASRPSFRMFASSCAPFDDHTTQWNFGSMPQAPTGCSPSTATTFWAMDSRRNWPHLPAEHAE